MQSAELGNLGHVVSSASVLAYTVLAMLFARPGSNFFDEKWIEDGFCVINKDVPYWNSHDLCLYADVVLVLLCGAVYYALRGAPRMKSADELMLFNLIGHLGHGVAHGFIALNYRRGHRGVEHVTGLERFAEIERFEIVQMTVVSLCFWLGLLKGVMPTIRNTTIVLAAISVHVGGLFVKDVLGFAYVQAVLAVAFASTQLNLPRKEKDFAYAAFALSSIPLSLIPWVESTGCQAIASRLGGHLIYDVAIPIILTSAYYASWHYYKSNEKKTA